MICSFIGLAAEFLLLRYAVSLPVIVIVIYSEASQSALSLDYPGIQLFLSAVVSVLDQTAVVVCEVA